MRFKHDNTQMVERLIIIMTRLFHGKTLSQKALAQEFGRSEKTIRRDFAKYLSRLPLEQTPQGWRLQNSLRTPDESTQFSLEILGNFAKAVGLHFYRRVSDVLHAGSLEYLDTIRIISQFEDISDRTAAVRILERAIAEQKMVRCVYINNKGESKARHLAPGKIVNDRGYWYLAAFEEGKMKTFKLMNIAQLRTDEEVFDVTPSMKAELETLHNVWHDGSAEPYDVRLYVAPTIAGYIETQPLHPTQTITECHTDGGRVITLCVTSDMELLPAIRHWLPDIIPLSPPSLRRQLKKDVEKFMATCATMDTPVSEG